MSTRDLYFCLPILTIQEFGLPETLIFTGFNFKSGFTVFKFKSGFTVFKFNFCFRDFKFNFCFKLFVLLFTLTSVCKEFVSFPDNLALSFVFD